MTPIILALLLATGTRAAVPVPVRATASSEWGAGYGAAQAVNGTLHVEGDYWQTVQGQDQGAWIRLDLGRAAHLRAVTLTWARYQGRVHCPPSSIRVLAGLRTDDASLTAVREIVREELPADGAPYNARRTWRYEIPGGPRVRYLQLLFAGSQDGARYPGYLCLGEVEVEAPELAPRLLAIEGRFGRAEIDTAFPSLACLTLRRPDGRLEPESILTRVGHREWARGAYTYLLGEDGTRYESRWLPPVAVTETRSDEGCGVRLRGVRLVSADEEPVAMEDWALYPSGDELVWRIARRYGRDLTVRLEGSPGLFFSFDARRLRNAVTSTVWYDPSRMTAKADSAYSLVSLPGRVSENHLQAIHDRDTWAIYKLWTNWESASDLRLAVEGGYLYRRGSYAFVSEAGATVASAAARRAAHSRETITLRLAPREAASTGHQLVVSIPDKRTESSLKSFYGSLLNGGTVNDQLGYDLGNETDGWYYAGSAWMQGLAIAAGVPAPGRLAARPFDMGRAFRGHLAHILATVGPDGRARFGYNQGGEWVDDNLHTIIGTRAYLLHTGDLEFVREHLPTLERMLGYFAQRRNERGLFALESTGSHWYYDAVTISGVVGYYNAFLYEAASALGEMEDATGHADKAAEFRALADSVRVAFNDVLWRDDLPGGPRYVDWIDAQGHEVAYFCDLCQWPPVAVGIASKDQARKIVATADARLAELARTHAYRGYAGLSALWPVPPDANPLAWQTFGVYMNGGSLLCQTYWEVMARTRAGDAEGAYRRLQLFAERARRTRWAGDNAFTIRGRPQGDTEPYLADMVVVPAALIHGIVGVHPTWEALDVKPCLPPGWGRVETDVLYKGKRHHVAIDGDRVRVTRIH